MFDICKKKSFAFGITILFIGAGFVPSISSDEPLSRGTIYVDDNASSGWYDATHVRTIQEGINNATSGDTVYVYNGTYQENIRINKTITLLGENKPTLFSMAEEAEMLSTLLQIQLLSVF